MMSLQRKLNLTMKAMYQSLAEFPDPDLDPSLVQDPDRFLGHLDQEVLVLDLDLGQGQV